VTTPTLGGRPDVGRRGTVLVVDDEAGVRASIRAILEESCDVLEAEHGVAALEVLKGHEVDLVMLDQRMPGDPGIELLPRVKALDPTIVVVLATAVHDVRTAVEAMRLGAYDYLVKPFDVDDILLLVRRALEKRALEREVLCLRSALTPSGVETVGFEGMVGRHPEMIRTYQLVTQIAETPATVLITGESGTGKELIARAIHRRSLRRDQPFVALNVAAIPDTLLESELFGHERGAFTGAHARKLGKFELAHGGTVFLDEIGSLRLDLQTKLLRVLQEREVERVGGSRPVPVDVRVLAATNVNLRQAVRERAFREDLFYRLNVVPIHVPPLRERREDIPLLVEHFRKLLNADLRKEIKGVSREVLDRFLDYAWPGNIRELRHLLEHAFIRCHESVVTVDHLPPDFLTAAPPSASADRKTASEVERERLLNALNSCGWNKSKAARRLGLDRKTIYRQMKRFGLEEPPRDSEPGVAHLHRR
jgi:DNA-binding NtrC family response regulator